MDAQTSGLVLVMLGSSLWVLIDASNNGIRKGQLKGQGLVASLKPLFRPEKQIDG